MGQVHTTSNDHDYSKFKEKYEIKKKILDKRYGEGMLAEDKTTKAESFLKEYTSASANSSQEFVSKLRHKENMKNPYIIDIIDYFTYRETHYCSETQKTLVLFEFCSKNLEMEVNDRASDNVRHFSNEEIIYLTESYITGLAFLQSNHIHHSSLSLHTLFISKNGIYKIADQTFLNIPTNFEQVQLKKPDLKGIYLSPEQILALKVNHSTITEYSYKSDVFVLGICLLHAALLIPCDDIFNYEEMVYYPQVLEQKLESLKEFYSNTIVSFLRTMIQENETERPDFVSLNENLAKILKISQYSESQRNTHRKTTDEYLNFEKETHARRVHKDMENMMSALPLHVKNKISQDFTKYDSAKVREIPSVLSRGSHFKKPKQLNLTSIEQINVINEEKEKEESEIGVFRDDFTDDMEINNLLKEYGFEPLKKSFQPISSNNKQITVSQIMPTHQPFNDDAKTKKSSQFNEPSSTQLEKKPILHTQGLPGIYSSSGGKVTSLKTSLKSSKHFIEHFSNGSKFEGEKQNGIRNGKGRFTFVNGAFYDGEWKDNKKEGPGILVNDDGKTIYEGSWANDKYHGRGILYNQEINFTNEEFEYEDFENLDGKWIRFEGFFEEDEKKGKGVLYLINGERFYGNFGNDRANGNGSFYRKNGSVINGVWKNNKLFEQA